MTKILLVDRFSAFREVLASRIAKHPDLESCGEAADEAEALRLIVAANPAVAVIDIDLNTGNGIDLIKRAQAHNDCPAFVVWSMHTDCMYAERALRAGALAYVTKGRPTEEVIAAIRHVLAGGRAYISPDLSPGLMERALGRDGKTPRMEALSDRELQTFELIGQGFSTRQVAERMHISAKTVETYRVRIKEKLGISNINELIRNAVQWVSRDGNGLG